ncbi:MAG: DUF4493 domain-containing protein [Rikenellaceae bacterium]
MRQIIHIIITSLVLLSAVSCSRNDQMDGSTSEAEGSLKLSYTLSDSRSSDSSSDAILENSTLKVYRGDGGLIRYYSPATDAPEELFLVAGDYSVTLTAGQSNSIASSTAECTYYGSAEFTIKAGNSSQVDLNCPMLNSAVEIIYDQTIEESFEEGYITYVTAADALPEEFDELYTMSFTESGVGYFILPSGVSNLSWSFSGTHTDPLVGQITSQGVIEAPEEATLYALTFKYSKTAEGGITISLTIDGQGEVHDDNIGFLPQPTITPIYFSLTEVHDYYSGTTYSFDVSSINALSDIEIELLDGDDTIVGSYAPYIGGVEQNLAAQGVVYTAKSGTSGLLTIGEELFASFSSGGIKSINILATDVVTAHSQVTPQFRVTGLLANPTSDLWCNTVDIEACVISDQSHDVEIAYRQTGATEWISASATTDGDGNYSAKFLPTWNQSTSGGEDTVYTLDTGVRADCSYEYKYSIDGVEQQQLSFTTEGVQTISHAGLEDSSLSCWGSSNASSDWWCSGNNSMATKLCTQGTYAGMGDSSCALLAGASVTLVKIAAGNLALGRFDKPDSFHGTVSFGQPFNWQSRPSTFKFKYAASIGVIDASYHSGAALSVGDQDMARVFFAIVDWSSRHDVKSGTSSPTGVWDPETMTEVDEGRIIGYASQYIKESTTGDMIESELTVYYYDTEIKPSSDISIVISCATSAYGDYMTGCTTNKLYVDDFEFSY